MSSPFRHGPSAFSDPDSTARPPSSVYRFTSPYAHISPTPPSNSHFYTHPSRTSLLNASGDLSIEASHITDRQPCSGTDVTSSREMNRTTRSALPSFSRAFEAFTTNDGSDSSTSTDDKFFLPSYLLNSTYVQELEEACVAKPDPKPEPRKFRESGRSSAGISSNATANLPRGGHRAMTYTVVERPPPFLEDDAKILSPLPSRWNREECRGSIEVMPGGLTVNNVEPRTYIEREYEACGARTDHFMPPQCGIYYYEVTIMEGKRDEILVSVGFSTQRASLTRPIGWEAESWGYHADDGRCFNAHKEGRSYGPSYGIGDVVGCGINFRDRTAFFTKNGTKIGVAFHDVIKENLYPTISLKKAGESVLANFGQLPFVYKIDDMMREEEATTRQQIEDADTSHLEPGMSETDLGQALVLQFLQHDGYVETARAFAEEIRIQKVALSLDPNAEPSGIDIKDDEDAHNRQRIRRAILDGDIDRALKLTNAYYPRVLAENEQVHFKLRCRRFVEMVRQAAQLNMNGNAARPDPDVSGAGAQDMDIDVNGNDKPSWDDTMETDHVEGVKLEELELEILSYGQALQAEYAEDARPEVEKALGEIWSLMAYTNPLKELSVSHLLSRKGRSDVSEELNSAILRSLGKTSPVALERIYAQAKVLLEDLREDGGDGAFVSIPVIIGDIPGSTHLL